MLTSTVTALPLFLAPKKISVTVQATLYASLVGFTLTFIIVLAMAKQHEPASWITRAHLGTSGWSDGTAWLLGISNAMYAFGGTDGGKIYLANPMLLRLFYSKTLNPMFLEANQIDTAIHISEEMHNPGKRVPQVMMATMGIGLLTTLPLMIAIMFCMSDLDAVIKSPLPSLEIIYQW